MARGALAARSAINGHASEDYVNSWTIAAVLASTVTIAHAQEAHSVASRDRVHEPERVLGDHVFLAPAFMPTPFLSHHVGLQQGVTQVTIDDFAITENLRLD